MTPVPDAVQRAVEHRQPSSVGEGLGDVRLGDVRLGVTHQALELLTGRFDVGSVDRVRLPAPAVAVVGQPDGPAAREDGGAPCRHLVEVGGCVPIDAPVRVSRASVRRVPSAARAPRNAPPSTRLHGSPRLDHVTPGRRRSTWNVVVHLAADYFDALTPAAPVRMSEYSASSCRRTAASSPPQGPRSRSASPRLTAAAPEVGDSPRGAGSRRSSESCATIEAFPGPAR